MTDPVAWAFATGGDYAEQFDWLTEVLAGDGGNTQHRSLRETPRVLLSFAGLESGDNRRWMEVLLRSNSAGRWWVPVGVDSFWLGAAAPASAAVLSVSGEAFASARMVEGGHVMLVDPNNPHRFEVQEVAVGGIGVDTLSLEGLVGLAYDWPAGTQVVPVRRGRLAEAPQVGRFTADHTGLISLKFRLEDPLEDDAEFPGELYRGYPVFDFIVPVWTTDPVWTPERLQASVDFEVAVPVMVDTAGAALGKTTMSFVPDTLPGVVGFRAALFVLSGRASPTWVPSWTHDLRILAPVTNGATHIDVAGPLFSAPETGLQDNHRDIRIALANGTVLYRRITTAVSLGGGVERLTLDSAIATGFSVAQVSMTCFMGLCVQDSDSVLLRYFGPTAAQCDLVWRELKHGL